MIHDPITIRQLHLEPVAEIVECPVMGQQTVREIDGRWRFLNYGDLLYASHKQPVDEEYYKELADMTKQRDVLLQSIHELAVRSGIVRRDAPITIPQAMMLCDNIAELIDLTELD